MCYRTTISKGLLNRISIATLTEWKDSIKRWGLGLYLFLFLFSMWDGRGNAFYVESDASGRILITNTHHIPSAHYYLVWLDVDGFMNGESHAISSFSQEKGWVFDAIIPYNNLSFPIDPFSPTPITSMPQTCKQGHACIIALLAQPPSCDITTLTGCPLSIFPLSKEAAQKRYPGQSFFLISDPSPYDTISTGSTGLLLSGPGTEDAQKAETITQQPDIYAIEGNRLFFANSIAQKLQLIDLREMQPSMVSSLHFTGTPKELYVFDGRCYLIEENTKDQKTRLLTINTANNQLEIEQTLEMDGLFKASRRRNNIIYLITHIETQKLIHEPPSEERPGVVLSSYEPETLINAYRIGEDGRCNLTDSERIAGANQISTISSDYLIIVTSGYSSTAYETVIHVYSLKTHASPLKNIGSITLPSSTIPSEDHISIDDIGGFLRMVYGDQSWGRSKGSTLAIYDLTDMEQRKDVKPIGSIAGIAPGEQLFATFFAKNRAYIVTYKNKDPLWVLDISNPYSPKYLGRLEVPGWSERLFFNNSLLLGIGFDDQRYGSSDSPATRRVSVSLFDVTDPAHPLLKDRLTPFAGNASVSYTFSEATTDERALLLDWNTGYGAFSIDTWQAFSNTYLQSFRLNDMRIEDMGKVSFAVPIRRAIPVNDTRLLALGEQELFLLDKTSTPHRIMSSLELMRNITWLGISESSQKLLAGASGKNGIYKLFEYNPLDITDSKLISCMSGSYQQGVFSDDKVFFYSTYPELVGQIVQIKDGKTTAKQRIKDSNLSLESKPILYEEKLFIVERVNNKILNDAKLTDQNVNMSSIPSVMDESSSLIILEEYHIDMEKGITPEASFIIPGKPIGFNEEGHLICVEANEKGRMRINLITITDNRAIIKTTKETACNYWGSQIAMDNPTNGKHIYLTCNPIITNEYPKSYLSTSDMDQTNKIIAPSWYEDRYLLWLDANTIENQSGSPKNGFRIEGLAGVLAGKGDTVVVLQSMGWQPCPPGMYCITKDAMVMPYYQPKSRIVKLTSDGALLGDTIDDVYSEEELVILNSHIYIARKAKEIEVLSLKSEQQ